jgi:FixJ family two-component response regulator
MQKRLEALHLRVINYLSHFAEDKYKMFLDVYPEIVQRVPQHMIASYLGIKPETLSRNRKKMATRKSSQ